MAVASDGHLQPSVLAEHEAKQLHETAARAAATRKARSSSTRDAECDVTFGELTDDRPDDPGTSVSWLDVRSKALKYGLIAGQVVASDVGFYSGTPFTLLRVGQATIAGNPVDDVFVLYAKGSIAVDGVRYCTDDSGYVGVPQVGDDIVFVNGTPLDSAGVVYRPRAEDLFYYRGGQIVTGRRLHDAPEIRKIETLGGLARSLSQPLDATR
jgi:hypothetical protein